MAQLTSMHFYGWKKGLKTGMVSFSILLPEQVLLVSDYFSYCYFLSSITCVLALQLERSSSPSIKLLSVSKESSSALFLDLSLIWLSFFHFSQTPPRLPTRSQSLLPPLPSLFRKSTVLRLSATSPTEFLGLQSLHLSANLLPLPSAFSSLSRSRRRKATRRRSPTKRLFEGEKSVN